jgi:hypothetical protein
MSDPADIYGLPPPDLRVPRRLPLSAHASPRSLSRTMGYRDNACQPHLGAAAIHLASYKFEQRRQLGCTGAVENHGTRQTRRFAEPHWPIPSARARRWSRLRPTLEANRRNRVGVELTTATVGLWSVLLIRSGPRRNRVDRPFPRGHERPIRAMKVWDPIRIRVIMEPSCLHGIAAGGARR